MGDSSISENTQQLVNDIQSLQNYEQQMFSTLENNPNLTSDQQQDYITKIQNLSNMRLNLYETMGGVNNFFKNALVTSQGTLREQTTAIEMIEHELNRAKRRLEILEEKKNNNIRMAQINTYYSDRYSEHADIMKIIIATLIPVIIFALLHSRDLIPTSIYYLLVSIIALIGGVYFWRVYFSIISRDNMDYQEYDWYFDASAAPLPGQSSVQNDWGADVGGCTDSYCCASGTIWNETKNVCLPSSSGSNVSFSTTNFNPEGFTSSEGMISKALTKTSTTNKHKQNNNSNFKPKSTESFINYK
jgi:hypothetical protein